MNKAPAEQWKKTLENMGASKAEMEWMGIDDFFAENPKPTKQEFIAFIIFHQNEPNQIHLSFLKSRISHSTVPLYLPIQYVL